jgi:hypothetical protein
MSHLATRRAFNLGANSLEDTLFKVKRISFLFRYFAIIGIA